MQTHVTGWQRLLTATVSAVFRGQGVADLHKVLCVARPRHRVVVIAQQHRDVDIMVTSLEGLPRRDSDPGAVGKA